jgi:hypothetical protein
MSEWEEAFASPDFALTQWLNDVVGSHEEGSAAVDLDESLPTSRYSCIVAKCIATQHSTVC